MLVALLSLAAARATEQDRTGGRGGNADNGATPTAHGAKAHSGYHYLGEELQALQDDDFANPGLLWVDRGRELWNTANADGGPSCRDCHGAPEALGDVAARMPRWDPARGGLENLEMQINECRVQRQDAPAWEWESRPLLATTALVGHVAAGAPVAVEIDGPAAAAFERGRREYARRRGQLDLACRHCHSRHAGDRLRGDVISEGMINGFPIYRLTWQTLGSRHRMFRWCNEAVRAQPRAFGSEAYLALELYLAWRGRGLPLETPAVRR